MTTQILYRAVRKLTRPLRRYLQATPSPASLDDLHGATLVLIAHPDDEVFCSGLICELRAKKQEVHLVSFTRGEGGERGDIPQDAQLSTVREKELRLACDCLDITSLTFLDFVDPISIDGQLAEPVHDNFQVINDLKNLVSQLSISNLITHGSSGEYWHPAHLCLHHHSRSLNNILPALQLWTINARTPNNKLLAVVNQDDPANLTIDTSAHSEQRLKSLQCHHSQQNVFKRFANGSLSDFISLTATESYRKW